MPTTNARLGRLLVASTSEHDWSAPVEAAVALAGQLDADRVLAAANYHRVVGCVQASVAGDPRTPPALVEGLAAASRRASGRSLLVLAGLRAVASTLGSGVPWLVLKGPVLDHAVYPRARLRTYRDLDVLVPPDRFEEAVELLQGAGYRVTDRNWALIRQTMASQLHLEREGSAPIDLHWTLLFDEDLRAVFRFPVREMVARARTVDVAGLPVATLDPVDTLVHLGVHAAAEGGDRLVWLKDVDVAARAVTDWDEVVVRSIAGGSGLPVATMLARTARTLGSPIPEDVVARLAPPGWRRLAAVLDRAFPAAASRGLGSPATLLARAVRGDTGSSLAGAAAGLRHRAGQLVRGRFHRVDRRFDAAHEGSLLHPLGDEADRAAFFDALARV
ncbi:MAG: nucleotidyltransferase family protein [Acidimicrobiia bacterium]